MKRRRPVRHVRRVKVKGGHKLRTVNPEVRRRFIVSRRGRLSGDKRLIFSNIARLHGREVGGYLDFNKRGLENANMYFGDSRSVYIPDEDYEVDWHTHPQSKDRFVDKLKFPSVEDIEELLRVKDRQASAVFNRLGSVVVITKTPRTSAYLASRHDLKSDLKNFERFLQEHINDEDLLSKLNAGNVFGFRFVLSEKGSLTVPIKVKE